jgi:hypothetical protein
MKKVHGFRWHIEPLWEALIKQLEGVSPGTASAHHSQSPKPGDPNYDPYTQGIGPAVDDSGDTKI